MESYYMKLRYLTYHGCASYYKWSQIIGIDEDDKEGEYCVHYNGWNKASVTTLVIITLLC